MPGHTSSSGAAVLEGLVGGFLLGRDVRRQRTFDRQDADDRRRRIATEDEDRRFLHDDRETDAESLRRQNERQERIDDIAEEMSRRNRLEQEVRLASKGFAFDPDEGPLPVTDESRRLPFDASDPQDFATQIRGRVGTELVGFTPPSFFPKDRTNRLFRGSRGSAAPREIDESVGGNDFVPKGLYRVPEFQSPEDIEEAEFHRRVADFLSLSEEDRVKAMQDPLVIEALLGLGFGGVVQDQLGGADSRHPLGYQRFLGPGGQMVFNPNDGTSRPLLDDEGNQVPGPPSGDADPNLVYLQSVLAEVDNIYAEARERGNTPTEVKNANRAANATAKRHGYGTMANLVRVMERLMPGRQPVEEDVQPLLYEALQSQQLSEEEKQIARDIAESPEFEGQRAALLLELLGRGQ